VSTLERLSKLVVGEYRDIGPFMELFRAAVIEVMEEHMEGLQQSAQHARDLIDPPGTDFPFVDRFPDRERAREMQERPRITYDNDDGITYG
jgi:hypothetical protein